MRLLRFAGRCALALSTIGSAPCTAQTVFVSIPPQAFVVDRLAADLVRTEVLLPPGASPATYEPTPRQMAALEHSQLYLQIGVPFEGPILVKIADLMPGLRVVDCRRGVELEPIDGHHHGHGTGSPDPHIWLDPQRMEIVARNTADALRELLPAKSSAIEGRLADLLSDIDETDGRVTRILEPCAGRTFLVFHPAYGYFARRYGLVQRAIETDGKAPSARSLASVIDESRTRSVRALFVQPQFSRSVAERVATALDCKLIELDPLSEDYLVNLEQMAARIAEALQ